MCAGGGGGGRYRKNFQARCGERHQSNDRPDVELGTVAPAVRRETRALCRGH